jgi:hypothetical protein
MDSAMAALFFCQSSDIDTSNWLKLTAHAADKRIIRADGWAHLPGMQAPAWRSTSVIDISI